MKDADASGSRAVEMLSKVTTEHPDDADQRLKFVDAQVERAAELRAAGRRDVAGAQAHAALQTAEQLLAKDPNDRMKLLAAMQARLLLASVDGDANDAKTQREHVLQTVQAVKVGKTDPRLLALHVEALLGLDRKRDAQPLVRLLWDEGYREPEFVSLLQRARIDYPANSAFQSRLLAATSDTDDNAARKTADVAHN